MKTFGTKAVKAIIMVNNKFLILEKSRIGTDNIWDFPGGLIENGESELTALNRELSEELNIDFESVNWEKFGTWSFIRSYDSKEVKVTNYFYDLKNRNFKIKLSEEHISFKWVEPQKVIEYNLKDKSLYKLLNEKFGIKKIGRKERNANNVYKT